MIAEDKMLTARAQMPVLAESVYLNACSTGALPRAARDAMAELGDLWMHWRDELWRDRFFGELAGHENALASLVGGAPGSVVTDANVATLLGRVVSCFDFRERPKLVTTTLDFPTAPFLFKGFARYGAEPAVVPSRDGVRIDLEGVLSAIDARTRLVCIPHAVPTTGALVDVRTIVRRAHEMGALVAVDAFATVGAVPIDVGEWNVDFLLGGSHKFLCGMGAAFLYVKPSLLPSLTPAVTGWMGTADPLAFGDASTHAPGTRRFLAGTPSVVGALASKAGLATVTDIGVPAIREVSVRRTGRILERAVAAGMKAITPTDPNERGAIACVSFPGDRDVFQTLLAQGFVTSYRGSIRVAPHFYNTDEEIERFCDSMIALRDEAAR